MKVTFPHMGNLYIALKVLFDTVGVQYAIPSPARKKLEQGIIHSPEFACMPFKITLGDIIDGLEQGASHVLFGGGCGQCRFGYYADLQSFILESIGFSFEKVRLDSSNITLKEFIKKFKGLAPNTNAFNILKAVVFAAVTVFKTDNLNKLAGKLRCREQNPGATDRRMKKFHDAALISNGYWEISSLIRKTRRELKKINIDRHKRPLKVALTGEIYT